MVPQDPPPPPCQPVGGPRHGSPEGEGVRERGSNDPLPRAQANLPPAFWTFGLQTPTPSPPPLSNTLGMPLLHAYLWWSDPTFLWRDWTPVVRPYTYGDAPAPRRPGPAEATPPGRGRRRHAMPPSSRDSPSTDRVQPRPNFKGDGSRTRDSCPSHRDSDPCLASWGSPSPFQTPALTRLAQT